MNAKHTPGPWKCDENGVVTGGPDYCSSICETYRRRWAVPEGLGAFVDQLTRDELVAQNDANGRLVAAAPELLEACRRALSRLETIERDHGVHSYETIPDLRAAIAKATS